MDSDTQVKTQEAKRRLQNIRDFLPDASENLQEFCLHLSSYIGEGFITPSGYTLDYALLLDDLKKGIDGRTGNPLYGRTVRAGDIIYRALSHWAVVLAQICFGEDFADEVRRELSAAHLEGAVA